MFEFLLPRTRESQLRAALDDLFYCDTVEQRLREIGVMKLEERSSRGRLVKEPTHFTPAWSNSLVIASVATR